MKHKGIVQKQYLLGCDSDANSKHKTKAVHCTTDSGILTLARPAVFGGIEAQHGVEMAVAVSKPRQKLRHASAVGTATADGRVHQETPNSMTMHTTQCFRPHRQTGHDGERPERRGLLCFTGYFNVLPTALSSRCLSSSAYNHVASRRSWISVKRQTDKTHAVLQSLSTIIDLISRDGSCDARIA